MAENPVALEMNLLLRIPNTPPLYPETAIVIECHSWSLGSRVHAKDVNGPRGTPTFSAMADGQIKPNHLLMYNEYSIT